jgi:hypothetical protein
MKGCVCRLQSLLTLTSAVILRSESRGTHDNILLSQIRNSPNLEGQSPLQVTQLYPPALSSLFVASYDSQASGGGIRPRHHTQSQSQSYFTNGGLPPSNSSSRPVPRNSWSAIFCFQPKLAIIVLMALAIAVILKSESCGTHDDTLPSQIRQLPKLEGQVPVFTGWSDCNPLAWLR